MADLLTKLKRRICRQFYLDIGNDYKKTIFLAGTGRSGTTWVSNIINYDNDYRFIFEPFHPDKVNVSRRFGNRKYIRKESYSPELLNAAEIIFSGKIRNFWTDNFNTKIISNKRLVKCIRANLFLKWVHLNFPEMPIIFLLRHPCATVNSQVKFNLRVALEEYIAQKELVNDFLHPFIKDIEKAKDSSDFEKHIFIWCIENHVPLMQFKKDEICIVFYEHFCEKPEYEISKLFTFLNKNYSKEKILNAISKSSPLTRSWSAISKGEDLVSNWKENFTAEQIERAHEIVSLFGLNKIYDFNSSMPKENGLYDFI